MTVIEQALTGLWHIREKAERPYLLINDVRGYFAEAPEQISIDGSVIPIHVCTNEFSLRLCTEAERDSGNSTARIIISRKQLQPDHLPDLQARSSMSPRTITGCDAAKALGVSNPRALLDRLPVKAFWNLAPYLPQLETYSLERIILASLLKDTEILSSGWSADRILDKLWYESALPRIREILKAVEPDERQQLENEFLDVVKTWLDTPRFALVEAAVLENNPPPVLPVCLLASILEGWNMLTPERMRNFLDGTELGDLFIDIFNDGNDMSGLAEWGRRITVKDDFPCEEALSYLQKEIFPKHPSVITESLATVIKAVDGEGSERFLKQLIQLLEADGGILSQGLTVTLHALLDVVVNGELADKLPLERIPYKLTDTLDVPDSRQWEELLEALQKHQSREKYEDHVTLIEAMVTIHRLTHKAEEASANLTNLDWKKWIELIDKIYLPLMTMADEAERRSNQLPEKINVFRITQRAKKACKQIRAAWADFYVKPNIGLPKWIKERQYAPGTSRPWLNSDIMGAAVKPLLQDPGIEQVYLIVFDGMSVANWKMFRDRFLMVSGRELFRTYEGLEKEYRACTYLPSITEYCRQAIFAGTTPKKFRSWPFGKSEPDLLKQCLTNITALPSGWDKNNHYLCYNEKEQNPDTLNRKVHELIDKPGKFKAIVFNLQDRLLQKGMSSLQEIMLVYVKEVALPHLRRISRQRKTALVITSDHGFAYYNKQYLIDDLISAPGHDREVFIHNRCLEYKTAARTSVGPEKVKIISPVSAFGLPDSINAVELTTGYDSYGWPQKRQNSSGNPYSINGNDHGGLTPEETVVPVAIFITKGVS